MKKYSLKIVCTLSLLLVFFTSFATTTLATSTSADNEKSTLSVQAIIPENQRDKSKTYFDLKMNPGQKQTIEVDLTNHSSKEIEVEVQANDATTNNNGIVEYTKVKKQRDPSLKVGFSDIATTEATVKVPENQTKKAKITLTMPEKEFAGEILGGLYIKEKNQQPAKKNDSKGNAVINRFAYTIGVLLTENEQTVSPYIQLQDVKASQTNYRNTISASIQNTQAITIRNLELDIKVFRKGSEKPLLSKISTDLRMAPNSNFEYLIPMGNKPFNAGTYLLKGTASIGEQHWTLEKEFTITAREVKKYNETAVELEDLFPWNLIYIIAGVIVILLIIISVLIYRIKKKNRKKKRNNKNSNKQSLSKKKKVSRKKE